MYNAGMRDGNQHATLARQETQDIDACDTDAKSQCAAYEHLSIHHSNHAPRPTGCVVHGVQPGSSVHKSAVDPGQCVCSA